MKQAHGLRSRCGFIPTENNGFVWGCQEYERGERIHGGYLIISDHGSSWEFNHGLCSKMASLQPMDHHHFPHSHDDF